MKCIRLSDGFVLIRHWGKWYVTHAPYETWTGVFPLERATKAGTKVTDLVAPDPVTNTDVANPQRKEPDDQQ